MSFQLFIILFLKKQIMLLILANTVQALPSLAAANAQQLQKVVKI